MTTVIKRSHKIFMWSAVAIVLVGGATTWLMLDPGFRPDDKFSSAASNPAPSDEFDRRVRDYIRNNPEVIVEALQTLQKRKNAQNQNELKSIIAERRDEIINDPDSPIAGNPNGDVTIVEFFDYNCPYCRRVGKVTNEVLRSDSKLRFVYKEWPILGSGSLYAAKAALAAIEQGKYIEFHEALMAANDRVSETNVMEIARRVGLDTEQLRSDIERPEIDKMLKRNAELARALRITGTPSFVVGDEIIRGATDVTTLQARINQVRKSK